ncbi:MAG TPA: hypothetical protein VGU90_09150 [Terriglobales bacterium]|nr:hypothetical protein [Terriglobales bacterium]
MTKAAAHFDAQTIALMKVALDEAWDRLPPKLQATMLKTTLAERILKSAADTITVARQESKTVSELSFLTAVHTARGIAKQEKISEIFVCTATTSWPTPTIPHSPPVGTADL